MKSYVDGSEKGRLRFADIDTGESLFVLNSGFTDKVTCLVYDREKNVLFAGSRDGRFRVWKVPKEWRSKEIDNLEKEFEYSRKEVLKLKGSFVEKV